MHMHSLNNNNLLLGIIKKIMAMITPLIEVPIAIGKEVEVIMVENDQLKIMLLKKIIIEIEMNMGIQVLISQGSQIINLKIEIMKQVMLQNQIEIKIEIIIRVNLKIHIGLEIMITIKNLKMK